MGGHWQQPVTPHKIDCKVFNLGLFNCGCYQGICLLLDYTGHEQLRRH